MPIVEYFEVAANFELAPTEALAFFQAKGLKPTFAWQDMLGDEHDLAFTVAKMMDMDLLSTVKDKVDQALANGDSLADFKRELIPKLQAAGWWGKKDVIDPKTGEVVKAQLGSASRMETIFRTNLQSAYAVGRWQAIMDQADTAPYLLYDAVDDHRTRPEHAALDGLVLEVTDPFWNSHSPPNGWNCRCGVIQLDDDQLQDYGLREGKAPKVRTRKWTNPRTGDVHRVPTDLDPGWNHNPGKARYEQLKALAAEKAEALAAALAEKRAAAKLAEAQVKIDAQVAHYKAKVAKLKADQPALKGKLQAQVQKLAQGELDHHLVEKTPYLAQAIKTLQKSKAGQAMTPAELLNEAQQKALVLEQSAHLSAFKAKSIAGKPVSAKQQAVFDALPEAAQASIKADIDAKTGNAAAVAQLQQIADLDAGQYAATKAELLAEVPDWQNHPDPKALLAQIEAEGNLQGAASAQIFEHETLGTPYLAQALKAIKKTQAGKALKPAELLAEAEAKAKKLEHSAHLSSYKAKMVAGKEPSAKAKAAFVALPEEAQAAMLANIEAKLGITAAKAQLEQIAKGEAPEYPGLQKKLLAQWQANGTAESYSSPVALVEALAAAAKAQQAKATIGTLKAGYKKKVLAGHIPTPKQKAMFDALPDEEKVALLSEIDQAKAAKKDDISGIFDEVLKEVEAEAAAKKAAKNTPSNADLAKLIDEVIADEGAQANLQANVDQLLDGHKHQLSLSSLVEKLTGDMPGEPTVKQIVKYAALAPEDQAKIDALVLAKGGAQKLAKFKQDVPEPKAKAPSTDPDAAPVTPPATPDPKGDHPLPALDDLTQIGGQGGSNPGGLYQDTKTGTQWYIKRPSNPDQARNEVLAGKLYAAAGVDVPEMHWRNDPQGTQIYSKIVDGMGKDAAGLKAGKVKGVLDNFAVDAWLANWDVIGLGYDNLLVKAGRAIRIDTGAGLLYRAQGGPKGGNWNDQVGEIDSLRDAGLNPQAAAVYKHVTQADLIAGVRKVLSVDAKTIAALVDEFGPGDATVKADLVKTLKARQAALAKRFPEAVEAPKPVPAPKASRVSEQELTDIKAARVNGVALATDKDQIEDQQVLLWHKRNQQGQDVTGAYLKVRAKASKALDAMISKGSNQPIKLAELGDTGAQIKTLIIGINAQANKGDVLREKDITRLNGVRERLDTLLPQLKAAAGDSEASQAMRDRAKAAHAYLVTWQQEIDQATIGLKQGDKAKTIGSEFFKPEQLPDEITKPAPKQDQAAIQWTKTSNTYTLADLDKSRQSDSKDQYSLVGHHYVAEIDGAQVHYYPDNDDSKFALRGRLQIEVPGQDAEAAAKHFAILDKLGIDSSRASAADQEALYLQRIAYRYKVADQMIAAASTTAERRAWLEQQLNTQLDGARYQPQGQLQAFEHGRRAQLDPVVQNEKGWQKFSDDYVLHHRLYNGLLTDLPRILAGGGQMAPSTDKMRRGVPFGGMSPTTDLGTGGANYFFTRLFTRKAADSAGVGLKWKAKHVARLDAIHYDHDAFGKTYHNYPQLNGKHGISQLKQAARSKGNETIFKDSLSLFDDLDHIKAGNDRKAVIQLFKDAGYNQWPDGRSLEEVIKR